VSLVHESHVVAIHPLGWISSSPPWSARTSAARYGSTVITYAHRGIPRAHFALRTRAGRQKGIDEIDSHIVTINDDHRSNWDVKLLKQLMQPTTLGYSVCSGSVLGLGVGAGDCCPMLGQLGY